MSRLPKKQFCIYTTSQILYIKCKNGIIVDVAKGANSTMVRLVSLWEEDVMLAIIMNGCP